jgi:hypothetical protein
VVLCPGIWLTYGRFEQGFDFSSQEIEGSLSLEGSLFGKPEYATFSVILVDAKIEGLLSLVGATIEGALAMCSLQVGQNLIMSGTKGQPARFADVDLIRANIKGALDLSGATVAGSLGSCATHRPAPLAFRATRPRCGPVKFGTGNPCDRP